MAKRKKKRRAWTSSELRELKTMAQEDQGIANCQEAEENRRRDASKGFQHRALARLPFLIFRAHRNFVATARPGRLRSDPAGLCLFVARNRSAQGVLRLVRSFISLSVVLSQAEPLGINP